MEGRFRGGPAKPGSAADGKTRPNKTPRGESSRDRILAAAAAVLAERGFAGASMAEIAERAGGQAGSIYYHFESRDQLIKEVYLRGASLTFDHVTEMVAALPPTASARERLSTAIAEHVRVQLEISDYSRAVIRSIGQTPPDIQEAVTARFRRYGEFLDALIRDAVAEGSIDAGLDQSVTRMLIMGAANWTSEWFHKGGKSNAVEVGALAVRMFFDGFSPKSSGHDTAKAHRRNTRPSARS